MGAYQSGYAGVCYFLQKPLVSLVVPNGILKLETLVGHDHSGENWDGTVPDCGCQGCLQNIMEYYSVLFIKPGISQSLENYPAPV